MKSFLFLFITVLAVISAASIGLFCAIYFYKMHCLIYDGEFARAAPYAAKLVFQGMVLACMIKSFLRLKSMT